MLLALVVSVAAALYLGTQLLSDAPLVSQPPHASPAQVQTARSIAKRTRQALLQSHTATQFPISQQELTALPSLIVRAYPRLYTRFQPRPEGVVITASLQLPERLGGRYLSLRVLLPVTPELQLRQLQLGQLTLPDGLLQWLLPRALDLLLGEEQRQLLLQGLRLVESHPERILLRVHPPADPQQQIGQLLERVRGISGNDAPLNHRLIGDYYQQLSDAGAALNPQQWVSLTHFIGPLFRHIGATVAPGEETQHCRAAVMALALYLGSRQFEQLTGPVLDEAQRQLKPHGRTLLRGRVDLRQHFVYSAALQVLGEEGLSYAIGELKELLDANRGGSGFSFADLAADRAGTLFALTATASDARARQFLDQFEQPLREADLMIPIDRFPEGLSEAEFSAAYRDIGSPHYQALVDRIDRQLYGLRLYQTLDNQHP